MAPGLGRYALRRTALGAVQVLAISVLVFALTTLLPGDAAVVIAGDSPDPQRIADLRAALGLDDPWWRRLTDWLAGLTRGDLGRSLVSARPVGDAIAAALPATVVLTVLSLLILVPLGLGLGVLAARHRDRWPDRVITGTAVGVYAVPEFASAVVVITVLSLQAGLLPANALGAGSDLLASPAVLVLPVLVLVLRPLCSISRLVRAGVLQGRDSEWAAHLARLGLSPSRVVWAHVLPSQGAAVVQQLARTVDWLLGGVVVVEAVFVIPGLGTLMVDAVGSRDVPVLQALALLFGVVTVVVNLAADVTAHALNPRLELR